MTDIITANGSMIPLTELPPHLQVEIRKLAIIDIYKDQDKEQIKNKSIKIPVQVQKWLDSKKSEHTKRTYRKAINEWIDYLDGIGVHVLNATAEHVDDYVQILKEKRPSNTVRMKVSACSSFHAKMVRYHKHITENPFHGADLPAKEYKKAVKKDKTCPVMSEKEILIIEDRIMHRIEEINGIRSCDKKALASVRLLSLGVHFMRNYGLRSGAVQSIRLEGDIFIYTTKGDKSRSRKLKGETITLLYGSEDQPFAGYGTSALQKGFKRITTELEADGEIREAYTCHDIRHHYAQTLYSKTRDIIQVSRALDHASINITQIYLQDELGF